jgi:ankyrin repeat protein
MSIDLIKALHNNDYHELQRLSLQENFEDLLNIPHDKKLVPIWYMKKEDTWFRTDIFKLLVDHNAILDFTNEHGQTLLMYCIERGFNEMARALIENDCDLNSQDDAGMSALHYAVYNLDCDMVKILLMCDINKKLKDNCGKTARFYLLNDIRHQLTDKNKKKECLKLFNCIDLLIHETTR